jgi:hypothetical protein
MSCSRFGGATALVDDSLSDGSEAPSSRFCVVEVASSDGLVVISYAYPFDSGLNHAALLVEFERDEQREGVNNSNGGMTSTLTGDIQ